MSELDIYRDNLNEAVEALASVTAHLIAAKSLAEENHRLIAPSKRDGLHSTRMKDFQKAIDQGRKVLGWTRENGL